jgi:hypothetical protein
MVKQELPKEKGAPSERTPLYEPTFYILLTLTKARKHGYAILFRLQSNQRWKMEGLFFREVRYFPRAYLDARLYHANLGAGERPASSTVEGEESKTEAERGAPWGEAFTGAIPFLLFGLAYLLEGLAKLSGDSHLAFILPGGSLGWGAMNLTLPMGVYFACAVGLSFGTMKSFPR